MTGSVLFASSDIPLSLDSEQKLGQVEIQGTDVRQLALLISFLLLFTPLEQFLL
jgi:hypothetical protein